MMNNTKLKHLLKNHTIGLSKSDDEWGLTVFPIENVKDRKNYTGSSFVSIIDQAYKELIKKKRQNDNNIDNM